MTNTDGKEYATKQELQETKQELLDKIDTRVSKEDFQREIKQLDGSIEILANQVGKKTLEFKALRGEMTGLRGEMNDRFGEMNEKFNTVINAIDGLSGQISDRHTEKAAGEHTFRRHENRLDEHENRIEELERKAG